MRSNKKRKRKNKGTRVFLFLMMSILLIVLCFVSYYYLQMGNLHFLKDTTINGMDVSEKNTLDVVNSMEEIYNQKEFQIVENGDIVYQGILSEVGYRVNSVKLLEEVENCLEQQNKDLIRNLIGQRDYKITVPFEMDVLVFQQKVTTDQLAGERFASEDARIELGENGYQIVEEIYGNQIEDEVLQDWVQKQIDEVLLNCKENETAKITLSPELYIKPVVYKDHELLVETISAYNKFCNASVTYQFGEQEMVVDWNTIKDWILINEGEGAVSKEEVTEFVEGLKAEYDTLYMTRTLTTSHGFDVTLPTNDYGYRIDKEAEINQLVADILSNSSVKREPIYSVSGYQRDGRDDVAGTYIEVDLTEQILWFYIDNELVVKSAVVSGMPKIQETSTGAFPIAYKTGPYVLTGGGEDDIDPWEEEVQYWMPFHDGQGLHDAVWREPGTFGGGMYLYNGSHGCVNLPPEKAEAIYERVEAGMPIFLYKTAEIPEEYLPEEESESESEG